MSFQPRGSEADALLTDLYLDALLAAHDRRASDAPADARLDPAVRLAATRLATDLGRVHPSFRFEERLAARLAEVGERMRLGLAAGAEGSRAILDPVGPYPGLDGLLDPALDPSAYPEAGRRARPLIIGGALTSAALSLAGAAYVAWRRSRPPLSPMARAVRAAGQGSAERRLDRLDRRLDRRGRRAGAASRGLD
jgi:hypothetical protein